jgi:hypothetical protein
MLRAFYNLDKSEINDLIKYITCNRESPSKGVLTEISTIGNDSTPFEMIDSERSDSDAVAIRNSILLKSTGATWDDVSGTSSQKVAAFFAATLGKTNMFSSVLNGSEVFGNSRIVPILSHYTTSRYNYNVESPIEINVHPGDYDPDSELLVSTSAETQNVKAISKGMISDITPNEDGTVSISIIVMNGKNDDFVYQMMSIEAPTEEERPEEHYDAPTNLPESEIDEETRREIEGREDAGNQGIDDDAVTEDELSLDSIYNEVTIEYGHLKSFPEDLKVGDVIQAGSAIGTLELNEWVTVKINADGDLIKMDNIITAAYASFGTFLEPNLLCDAYQDRQYNRSVPNFVGECTWFVWGRLYELYGVNWSYLQGNGCNVAGRLATYSSDWEFCDYPVAGGVISSGGPGGPGHVMFVVSFDPTTNELVWQDSWQRLWQASTFKGGTGQGWKQNTNILSGGPGGYSFTGTYASYGSITCARLVHPEEYEIAY